MTLAKSKGIIALACATMEQSSCVVIPKLICPTVHQEEFQIHGFTKGIEAKQRKQFSPSIPLMPCTYPAEDPGVCPQP